MGFREFCLISFVLRQTNLPEYQGPEKIVIRRYSDFVWLRDRLFDKYKGVFVPPLPEKSAVGKVDSFRFYYLQHIIYFDSKRCFVDAYASYYL